MAEQGMKTAAERTETLQRWLMLLEGDDLARSELMREMIWALNESILARGREDCRPDHVCDAQTCGYRGPCAQRLQQVAR